MRRVILIGYMGSGKTTIGRALSRELGLEFYDLDWYITNRMRRTVKQIFDERGEDGFRRIERSMLHEVAEFEDVVVSCGGGTPCFFDNIDYINRQGETVYLKCSTDVLFQHLHMGRTVRPKVLGKSPDELRAFIAREVKEREPYYTRARHTLDVSLMDNYQKIKETVARLREELAL